MMNDYGPETARSLASIARSLERIADALAVVNGGEFAAQLLLALERLQE